MPNNSAQFSSGLYSNFLNPMPDLAKEIADKVVADTKYFTAIVGLIGVVVGSILTIIGNIITHWLKERSAAKKDKSRKAVLREMLEDGAYPEHWRNLDTLKHVIGADEKTTKRLLLDIGARAS